MALIDYRGYRLVCVSILPISSNPSTLRYGSKDAGVNVVASDSVLNRRMKEAAEKLNLKGHMAGTGKCRCFLYGPADIEGHLSFKDKRYYVLDFARVFPPTAEKDVKQTFLYRLFCPEFVRNYHIPLSLDGFSRFGDPENELDHNQEVKEATDHLLNTTIAAFSQWLDQQQALNELSSEVLVGNHAGKIDIENQLTELLHMEGINCRYLGRVCNLVACKEVKKMIIHEMLSRVVKNNLRARMREISEQQSNENVLRQNSYRKCVLDFLNLLLGQDQLEAVESFWEQEMKQGLGKQFSFELQNDTLVQLQQGDERRRKKDERDRKSVV